MKLKIILILIINFTISSYVIAQKFYLKINSGFGQSFSSQSFSSQRIDPKYRYIFENVPISLGKGLYFGGAFGYTLKNKLGFELNFSYLTYPKKFTYSDDCYYSCSIDNNSVLYECIYNNTLSGKMLQFIPSLVLSTKIKNIVPYLKLGLILGIGIINDKEYLKENDTIREYHWQYSGKMAFGFNTIFGTSFDLNKPYSFFIEIFTNNLSYSPSKGNLEKYKKNGNNEDFSGFTNDFKNFKFVDSYNISTSSGIQRLKTNYPFSAVGINIGILYKFSFK